ncbi:blastoderm-specific protein 25D [Cotesia glomerata]|uniref:blastoderm-specific protein 25D n=1 Tax=Cotesia glomerata TaxID=32391 RepID=UPI001D021F85|nr:blastoderm-specific protein 25D [Cotesia glomerata]
MESSCDPYEQRLLSVFESCLEKGESELTEKGLRSLCDKLQLEERGSELISNLLNKNPGKNVYKISFEAFRNGLLTLLDSQEEDKVIESSILKRVNARQLGVGNGDLNMLLKNSISDGSVKRMLEQIFHKLDSDEDGLITFSEFLMLFQSNCSLEDGSLGTEWSDGEEGCKSSFTMLGPDHTGFIDRRSVISLWQLAGVSDAIVLLNDLAISAAGNINLSELMSVLTQELQSLAHEPKGSEITNTHLDILRATLVLYQEEVRSINVLVDQLTRERDKLKVDVAEANERANILAQEIDENHAKLEKSRNEQIKLIESRHGEVIKDLTLQHASEREAQLANLKSLNEQLQACQQEEQILRTKLAEALNENQSLEVDNQNLNDQIDKLKVSNGQLLIQVQALAAECDEAEHCDDRESEQVISLVDRIKKLQDESSLLRDQNDELTSEIELLKSRFSEKISKFSSMSSEDNSTDYEPLGKVPEFKKEDKVSLPNAIAGIINDLKSISIDKDFNSDLLQRNISEIINELEGHLDKAKDDKNLEAKEEKTSSLRDFVVSKSKRSIMSSEESIGKKLRDYPPRKGEFDRILTRSASVSVDVTDGNEEALRRDRDRLSSLLAEQEAKYSCDKKRLEEQCKKLETDLELLRSEYYSCEDYWENKLEEERAIMEQEQKISDDKLTELINKIAEYEEQFSGAEKKGRLSPIEEKFALEQSYTELEDEFDEFRREMQEALDEKETEINFVKEQLKKNESVDAGVQVEEDKNKRFSFYGQASKFEPGKLNKINEDCFCRDSGMQEAELQRLLQKKTQSAHLKCTSLMKQKECLVKEIMELQNFRNCHVYPNDGQGKVDMNFIKSLMTKVQVLEGKKKSLQVSLKHQKQYTDKVIECIWKQHFSERASLQHVLKETQGSLKQYLEVNKIQMQKLAKADLLIKDLYVENAHLKAKVDRLCERCVMLENSEARSTSV